MAIKNANIDSSNRILDRLERVFGKFKDREGILKLLMSKHG